MICALRVECISPVLESTICTFIYKRLLCVSICISGHPQKAPVVIKLSTTNLWALVHKLHILKKKIITFAIYTRSLPLLLISSHLLRWHFSVTEHDSIGRFRKMTLSRDCVCCQGGCWDNYIFPEYDLSVLSQVVQRCHQLYFYL